MVSHDSPARPACGPPAAIERWSAAIERVLERPELARPMFQPIADLERGTVAGHEALIRFRAAPAASPDRWLATGAPAGLVAQLEALAIRKALAARQQLPRNRFLSINASPSALLADEVREVLLDGRPLDGVVIEITEHAAAACDRLLPVIAELREAGALLAIDDAGSGYASLAQILALRPEFVKVDQRLIALLDRDEGKSAAVEMLGTLASHIDAWLIAEGVERLAELGALMRMRVPLAQGYALGRPTSAMSDLQPAATRYIRRRAPHSAGERVLAPLVESVPVVACDAAAGTVERLLEADTTLACVALLDRSGRPVALVQRDAKANSLVRSQVRMRVTPSSPVPAVARRALSRPAAERFQPIPCCDESGRLMGLIPFERLVQALTESPPPVGEGAPGLAGDGPVGEKYVSPEMGTDDAPAASTS